MNQASSLSDLLLLPDSVIILAFSLISMLVFVAMKTA